MTTAAFAELAETMEFLEDWEDRYRHIVELGRTLAPMADALKTPATKVEGCASQVWIQPMIAGSGPGARFDFVGDSDALIVRGLIGVMHALYAGLTVAEVAAVDAQAALARLGLDSHLSAQRSNGVRAMVGRIRALAAAAAAG
ncbi:MAG: SufE family protein [Gemmobacter sp.]|jgi:cysteine desulfuration protein SufE